MAKIYYKVVCWDLTSIVAKNTTLCTQYKIGEWVYPNVKYTDLMVFDNMYSAMTFREGPNSRVFECVVKNPRKRGLFIDWNFVDYGYDLPCDIKYLIEYKKKKKGYLKQLFKSPPEGTVFCSAVKLIKQIN